MSIPFAIQSAIYVLVQQQIKDVIPVGKEIILMRHGQPNLAGLDKVSALGMKRWIEQYDLSEIANPACPCSEFGAGRYRRNNRVKQCAPCAHICPGPGPSTHHRG